MTTRSRSKKARDDTPDVLKKEPKAAKHLSAEEEGPPPPSKVDRTKPGNPRQPAPRPDTEFNFYDPEVVNNRDKSRALVFEPTARRSLLKDARAERVIATRPGYYGHKLRQEGEVFDMFLSEKGFLPSWTRLATEDEIEKRFVPEIDEETGEEIPQVRGTKVPVLNNARPSTEGGNTVRPMTGGAQRARSDVEVDESRRQTRPRI